MMRGSTTISQLLLLWQLLLTLTSASGGDPNYTPTAFQTGPDAQPRASSFVSAAVYDAPNSQLILTGSTTGHDFDDEDIFDLVPGAYRCFVGVLPLKNNWQWQQRTTLGHASATAAGSAKTTLQASSQTCSHMALRRADNHLLLIGHAGTDHGGVLDTLYDRGSSILNTRYGTVLDLAPGDKYYSLKGGAVLQQAAAVYPVGLASLSQSSDFFVASMFTDQDEENPNEDFFDNPVDPNEVFPAGKTFGLTVEGYSKVVSTADLPAEASMRTANRNFVEFYAPASGASVSVAGMVQISPDLLVVAGHTKGQGPSFGADFETQANPAGNSPTMDGFVTKLSAVNGKLLNDENMAINSPEDWTSVLRIQSMDAGQETIHGLCHNAAQSSTDFVYLVGSTTGDLQRAELNAPASNQPRERKAFLMKVQISTMQTVWTQQVGTGTVEGSVRGISCAVTADGNDVWWAGHVDGGGLLPGSGTAQAGGEIDVFVSMVAAETGQPQFVRQFGSAQDDLLANRGGITCDAAGNAIVVGNTFGSLYRQKTEGTDTASVFVMTVSRYNGDLVPNFLNPNFEPPPGSAANNNNPGSDSFTGPSTPASTPAGAPSLPAAAPAPVPPSQQQPQDSTTIAVKDDKSSMEKWVALLLTLLVLIFAILGCAYLAGNWLNRDHAATDRAKVLSYLNSFDVEDVDLKHSATGGWHCSYANGLAQGEVQNKAGSPSSLSMGLFDSSPRKNGRADPLTAPLTTDSSPMHNSNSRIVKDSLFMDDEDAMEYGGRGLGGESPLGAAAGGGDAADGSGYDGLIDAYNRTWDDRSKPLKSGSERSRGSKGKRRSKKGSSKRSSGSGEPSWGRGIV